jgi:ABC-type antimicrobial peptide transport system permease subunit
VSERTQEVGVRLALGAEPSRVLGMVVRQAVTLAVVGVAIGLVSAAILAPLLTSQLFGVAAMDPATFLAVPVLLALVAVAAALVPGRRAMRIDPALAMRNE